MALAVINAVLGKPAEESSNEEPRVDESLNRFTATINNLEIESVKLKNKNKEFNQNKEYSIDENINKKSKEILEEEEEEEDFKSESLWFHTQSKVVK